MQRLSADLLSMSIHSAPAGVISRVPAGAENRRRLLDALSGLASERLVLHTCERFEVYAAGGIEDATAWIGHVAGWLDLVPQSLAPHVELRRDDEAARHLLRVAAGLESRLVGEPQIRGQVRQAFQEAQAARAVGPLLDALLRAALHAGRRVRRETLLGRGGSSIVGLGLDRLRETLGTVVGRTVIVAGTGSLASQAVAALNAAAARVVITSRAAERAEALASHFDTEAVGHDGLPDALGRADALIACTHGRIPIDEAAVVGRRFPIVDLGMPPNVDPRVAEWAGVGLTVLDDLTTTAAAPDVSKAAAIVEEEEVLFRRWRAGRRAAARVAELLRCAHHAHTRPSREERRTLHLEIERLKAEAAA